MNLLPSSPVTRPTMLAILIGLAAFVFYETLILVYPVVYWGDPHIRLALRDQILLGQWLPLLQILIVVVSKFSPSLLVIRSLLALIATGTLVAMASLGSRLFSPAAGLIAATFLAANMIFVALAIVPYTEVLFLGLLLVALELMDNPPWTPRFILGVLAFNLACLTRYEGWLLIPILVVETAWSAVRAANWKSLPFDTLRVACLCSIAPLIWFLIGIQEVGGLLERIQAIFAFETETATASLGSRFLSSFNPDYLRAFAVNFFQLLNWQAGSGIIILGLTGCLLAFFLARRRALHGRILAFAVADLSLLAFWQPQNLSSLRTAFIVEVFLVLYAAFGLEQLIRILFEKLVALTGKSRMPAWQGRVLAGIVLIILSFLVPAAAHFVDVSSHEADFFVPAQVAAWLKVHATTKDVVWVLSDDSFPSYALATYLQQPFDTILDSRFDRQQRETRLASARMVYLVELYETKEGLSGEERVLLDDLENGHLPAQRFLLDGTRLWIVPRDELAVKP